MKLNPYESPQTIDPPPLPPGVQQTHLEQVSFRNLSEIAWSYAIPGQIFLAALIVAIALVSVTWQFYDPVKNPTWVTIVMLGCGSILVVLVIWAWVMSTSAVSTLSKYVRQPPLLSKRERFLIVSGSLVTIYAIAPLMMAIIHKMTWGKIIPLPLLMMVLAYFWHVIKQQSILTAYWSSFLPEQQRDQSRENLRRVSIPGIAGTLVCLFVFILESGPFSIAWGWLILALLSAIVFVVPVTSIYRQYAQEFDKLWP